MFPTPRRLAVLVPASDPVVEADLHAFLPKGISFHVGRLPQAPAAKTAAFESLTGMVEAAPAVARTMTQVDPEMILFCCTSASFFKGHGWDREIIRRLEEAAGVPATTTSTAVAEALAAVGAKRLFMVTPYRDEINRIEVRFFKDHGFEVARSTTFDCAESRLIDKIQPQAIIDRVLEHRAEVDACDTLFISCTALRSMETVETLEAKLGKPVVTSNASTLWAAMKRLGVDASRVPAGRLFRLAAVSPPKARVA
jgi:maleate isomerase